MNCTLRDPPGASIDNYKKYGQDKCYYNNRFYV